eukprot:Blabericola_migrator_1__5523@NODE_2817_length_2320_cov_4909_253440_g1767_i0_p3_GENE_NODE_2817_length_2320_cov_4909_253440_g1767_i0NODE_2817_length_2320_cov_4909_253440_g1767_i0_p3_ORF_typecomplete_len219_score22_76Chromo/PF00385_24/0_043_NODE_2817_length_2320_cov_4909_253440_g1767_i015862242
MFDLCTLGFVNLCALSSAWCLLHVSINEEKLVCFSYFVLVHGFVKIVENFMCMTEREKLKNLHPHFLGVFADVLKGVSRIEDSAYDLELKNDVKRCLTYLKLLESFNEDDLPLRRDEVGSNCSRKRKCMMHCGEGGEDAEKTSVNTRSRSKRAASIWVIEKICGVDHGKFLVKWQGRKRKSWETEDVVRERDGWHFVVEYKRQWNEQNPGCEQYVIVD